MLYYSTALSLPSLCGCRTSALGQVPKTDQGLVSRVQGLGCGFCQPLFTLLSEMGKAPVPGAISNVLMQDFYVRLPNQHIEPQEIMKQAEPVGFPVLQESACKVVSDYNAVSSGSCVKKDAGLLLRNLFEVTVFGQPYHVLYIPLPIYTQYGHLI